MTYIAYIIWKKFDWLTEELVTEEDCAAFETRKEAEDHLKACHDDPTTRPEWRFSKSWIEKEEEE